MKKAYGGVSSGFTVVELIIVIAVIGMLAVISLVSYTGIQSRATASTLDQSLAQISKRIEIYKSKNGSYPTQFSQVDVPLDSGTQQYYSASAKSFCLSLEQKGVSRAIQGLNGVPTSGTCMAAINSWSLPANGAVTYAEAENVLKLNPPLSGSAVSPLVDNDGKANMRISYEVFATQPSVTRAPKGGAHIGSSYYAADGVTLVNNRTGYQGNGDASCQITLNQWNSCSWSAPTGPSVFKVKFILYSSPTSYTSDNIYRNVRIEPI